jgi:hypothetical protein
MTVVAYRDGVLASDSLVNDNNTRCGETNKIGRTKDGWLWGFVGTAHYKDGFSTWAEERAGDPPKIPVESGPGMLISPEGEVSEWWGDGWFVVEAPFAAWGSGSDLAVGAMAMGATAQQAVQVAIDFNVHCGGRLRIERLAVAPVENDDALDDEDDGLRPIQLNLGPRDDIPSAPDWRERRGL